MQKTANVTLKTVAATAGCSIAVASTVLNGSRGNTKVSDAMRRRILELTPLWRDMREMTRRTAHYYDRRH